MPKSFGVVITSAMLSALLNACGAGSGEGLDDNGSPVGGGGGSGGEPPPPGESVTLSKLQSDIFTPQCATCHAGGSAPRGLRLDSVENSFTFLVNIAADEIPELLRVNPGNADDSYLVRKIEGGPNIVGAQMPLGGTPLSSEDVAMVRQWINDGAPAPAASSVTTKVNRAQSKSYLDYVVIDLAFNRTLDTTVDPYALTLYRQHGGTNHLVDPGDFDVLQDGLTLQVIYTGKPSRAETIELRINDPAGGSLYDINGFQIDGDNNQVEGGEYRYVHTF